MNTTPTMWGHPVTPHEYDILHTPDTPIPYEVLLPGGGCMIRYSTHVEWVDSEGLPHRDQGPAVIGVTGEYLWCHHGVIHRDGDLPARRTANGTEEYWVAGEQHRDSGPAVIEPDGHRQWLHHGRLHRDDGPAEVFPDGSWAYYHEGLLHRSDGPAQCDSHGTLAWYQQGVLHRGDGLPAMLTATGTREWWWEGELHREGAPARVCGNGTQEYYLDGVLHNPDGPAVIDPDGTPHWMWKGAEIFESDFLEFTWTQPTNDDVYRAVARFHSHRQTATMSLPDVGLQPAPGDIDVSAHERLLPTGRRVPVARHHRHRTHARPQ